MWLIIFSAVVFASCLLTVALIGYDVAAMMGLPLPRLPYWLNGWIAGAAYFVVTAGALFYSGGTLAFWLLSFLRLTG